jgi:hypothetical protein
MCSAIEIEANHLLKIKQAESWSETIDHVSLKPAVLKPPRIQSNNGRFTRALKSIWVDVKNRVDKAPRERPRLVRQNR